MNSADFYSLSWQGGTLFLLVRTQILHFYETKLPYRVRLKFYVFKGHSIVDHFKLANTNLDDPFNLEKCQAYEEATQQHSLECINSVVRRLQYLDQIFILSL